MMTFPGGNAGFVSDPRGLAARLPKASAEFWPNSELS
jgi:hypothetical protein